MKEKLQKIREDAIRQIEASGDLSKLNDVRVAVLGKKGELTAVLKSMKDVSPEERPLVGQLVNETRESIEKILDETKKKLEAAELDAKLRREVIDVTLPAKKNNVGHPLQRTRAALCEKAQAGWNRGIRFRISPLILSGVGFFIILPLKQKEETSMSEEMNNQYSFENPEYRKTYWHTCSTFFRRIALVEACYSDFSCCSVLWCLCFPQQ